MTPEEFGAHIKTKYPEYNDLDNADLTKRVLAKYPEYSDMVDTSPQSPGTLESGALGLMSGIPGAETVVSGLRAISPKETYPEAHQALETLKDQAWEGHPVAYGAGKGAGMVGTGLALPVTSTLGGAAAIGAGIGAASGLDVASNPSEMPIEALKGAGTGAVLGSLGHGLGKAIEAIPGVAKSMLASTGEKTSLNDINAYLQNPEAIRSALSKEAIGSEIAGTAGEIGTASGHLSEGARSLLNPNENPLNVQDLQALVSGAKQKYLTDGLAVTSADQTAVKTLDGLYEQMREVARGNNDLVPEDVLRRTIDRLQAATKDSSWGNPEASASQDAMKHFSGQLNEVLRQANLAYGEAMAPSAEAAQLSTKLSDAFSLEKGQPTDTTFTKVGQIGKEGKLEGEDLLNQVKDMTGQDFIDMLQKSKIKEHLEAPGPGGALKTLMAGLGFGVGKMTGVPFGGIGGAAIGRYSAEAMNGGSIAKQIMDMYLNLGNTQTAQISKSALQKFGPLLIQAAKVGGNQLAATHFVLATSNPEYQQTIEHIQENQ
jgi:hypothetical protein